MSEFSVSEIKSLLKGYEIPEGNISAAANELCRRHNDGLEAIKTERDDERKKAQKADEYKQKLDALEEKVKTDYVPKEEHETMKKEYEDYKSDISAKTTRAATEKAVKAYLDSKGIKGDNLDLALMAVESKMSEFELDGDKIKDTKSLDELISGKFSRLVTETKQVGANIPHGLENAGTEKKEPSRAAKLEAQYHANLYGTTPTNQAKGE